MTLGSHQRTVGASQSHFTPRALVDALGSFDLDPCAGDPRPWNCATTNWTAADDGLSRPWTGRVWCNPPFDRYAVGAWVAAMAAHQSEILLLHARTETAWFRPVWRSAHSILFLATRLHFCDSAGVPQAANSGAPLVLAAFSPYDTIRLQRSGIAGSLVTRWTQI